MNRLTKGQERLLIMMFEDWDSGECCNMGEVMKDRLEYLERVHNYDVSAYKEMYKRRLNGKKN